MKKMNSIVVLAAAAAMIAPVPAWADAYCGPNVITQSLAYSDGSIKIRAPWRHDFVTVCNIKTIWKGIDPQLCWAWYSKIDNAVSKGSKIMIYYAGVPQEACATMPTYDGAPAPLYVELNP